MTTLTTALLLAALAGLAPRAAQETAPARQAGGSSVATAATGCVKPTLPSGGSSVQHDYNNFVQYTDDYMTLGDLTWPMDPPPACGWPLVILVHGLPGSRINQRDTADLIASHGYAVWAYEVRGQAQAVQLNPPDKGFTWYGPNEKYDLAEEVDFARQNFAGIVDPNRLAVTGNSQGAIHTWFSVAYSGRTVTVPGRGTIDFPRISCAVASNFNPDIHQHFLHGGTMFDAGLVDVAFTPGNVFLVKDTTFVTNARLAFTNQAPLVLNNTWKAETDRLWFTKLAQSDVPTLWSHSYLDQVSQPQSGFDALGAFAPDVPWRAMLSTNGHGSPTNFYESELSEDLRIRWFDRFLWGEQNGVEFEAKRTAAHVPLDAATRDDPNTVWRHRYDKSVEANDVDYERCLLYGPGSMGKVVPLNLGPPATITHDVPPSFTPQVWAASVPWPTAAVLAQIPLSEVVYETTPLGQDRELAGRVPVHLSVVPDVARFQVSALLEVVPPGQPAVALASWGVAILGATPFVPRDVEMVLPPVATVVPAGSVLRLRLRNIWLTDYPMPQLVKSVPFFQSATLQIQHGFGTALSYVDLPFRKSVRLSLDAQVTSVNFLNPQPTSLVIDGGPARAGQTYTILCSASGQVPGWSIGNATLPINFDPVSAFVGTASMLGNPGVVGFEGQLDANGRAVATIDWSLLPTLIGSVQDQRLTFAAWTTNGSATSVSNPSELRVE